MKCSFNRGFNEEELFKMVQKCAKETRSKLLILTGMRKAKWRPHYWKLKIRN